MSDSFQEGGDEPVMTASNEGSAPAEDRCDEVAPSNAQEGATEQTRMVEGESEAEGPLLKEEGGGEEEQVEKHPEEQHERDGDHTETEEPPNSDQHERMGQEASSNGLAGSADHNDTSKTKNADKGEDPSSPEKMDAGDGDTEKESCTCDNLVQMDEGSGDHSKKNSGEGNIDDERQQAGAEPPLDDGSKGGQMTVVAHPTPAKPDPANFLSALNLLPKKRPNGELADVESDCSCTLKRPRSANQNGSGGLGPAVAVTTAPPTLTQLFRKEPDSVVQLLAAALPMDSLSSLLKEEHKRSSAQLKQLRERLEKAHQTVEVCSQQKQPLLEQIDVVTEKIHQKQKQLKDTREDLRRLSNQESEIKAKRDTIHSKCSELRRKLLASREGLHQIQQLYANKRHATVKAVKTS